MRQLIVILLIFPLFFSCSSVHYERTKVAERITQDSLLNFKILTDSIPLTLNFEGAIFTSSKDVKYSLNLKDEEIEYIVYYSHSNYLYLILEIRNYNDYIHTIMVCIDFKKWTKKWQMEVGDGNISEGIIEANKLYIGFIGQISAIDLLKGKFVWNHDDLYDGYHCDFFSDITIDSKTVTFKMEKTEKSSDNQCYKRLIDLQVSKQTGQTVNEKIKLTNCKN